MAKNLTRTAWDKEHEDTRVALAAARLAGRRTLVAYKESQVKHDRVQRLLTQISHKSEDKRIQLSFEIRKMEEAQPQPGRGPPKRPRATPMGCRCPPVACSG